MFASAIAILAVILRYPFRYEDLIYKFAEEFDLEPALICAVIRAESGFDKDAVSSVGASGLMQIMESTARWLAPQMGLDDFDYDNILDPEINIRFGCFYLSMLANRYGDIHVALCAYNAGSGNVNEWLNDPEYSGDGKTLDSIPFAETRNYLKRVSDNQKVYAIILKFCR